jgi:hypothetical protein
MDRKGYATSGAANDAVATDNAVVGINDASLSLSTTLAEQMQGSASPAKPAPMMTTFGRVAA